MHLSERLKTIASFVTPGNRLADIGTDHAYIPIYLASAGKIPKAIAMDINQGPLDRAYLNIREAGLESVIETRISDGLSKLSQDEADTVLIAGMGGKLGIQIIEQGREVLQSVKEIVLSPQSEMEEVRRFLQMEALEIVKEEMILEDQKFYNVMKVMKGHMVYEKPIYYKYGKLLLEGRNDVLYHFLLKEKAAYYELIERFSSITSKTIAVRRNEILGKIRQIEEAIRYF